MKETMIQGIGWLLGQEDILPNRRAIVFGHGAGGGHFLPGSPGYHSGVSD